MASINTLVGDINQILREDKRFSSEGVANLQKTLGVALEDRLGKAGEAKVLKSALRMSNFGTSCDRKLWYSVNKPEIQEDFLPHTRLKFIYGEIIEQLVLGLASEAGHKVEGQQDELEIDGVYGHRDAVIDGVTIDVKSANSRGFQKFNKPLDELENDVWFVSYIDQLQLYMEASQNDPLVTVKKAGGFLAFDQEMGHITLKLVTKKEGYRDRVKHKKLMVNSATTPDRGYKDEPDGLSGNRKLCTFCSYCQFKKECWKGVRTFVASTGPKHLTIVKREPNMLEVK